MLATLRRIKQILGKLIENPGRIFFLRGAFLIDPFYETVPDSFSADYYLMIQQKARLQLIHTVQRVNKRQLWKLPWVAILFIKQVVQLRVVNLMVQSYLNEHLLMKQVMDESNTKNRHSEA
jgi:hypothetical protein